MPNLKPVVWLAALCAVAFAAPQSSSAEPGRTPTKRTRAKRSPKRSSKRSPKRSPTPTTKFTGRRTPRANAKKFLAPTRVSPNMPKLFGKPQKIPNPQGTSPKANVIDHPGLNPTAELVPPDPPAYSWYPVDQIGKPTGMLRVHEAEFLGWNAEELKMYSDQSVTLYVERPPAGKVAFVRCIVELSKDKKKKRVTGKMTVDMGQMVINRKLPQGGGLLEFTVLPGSSPAMAKIVAGPAANLKYFWQIQGCDLSIG